ncbi:MAG: large conductance mechanosensitive channel protein MscL [Clostridia bacterium]|nr:large conductance mechanosensitive channel protein MscL [Clostridia bacterium]
MRKFFKEFKEFISRGNILDMAVGVIIGGAFSAIVTAFTDKIIMPLVNLALAGAGGGLDSAYTFLKWVPSVDDPTVVDLTKSIYIDWGAFITAILNFLIIALTLFVIIKAAMASSKMLHKAGDDLKKGRLSKEEKRELKERGISCRDKKAVEEFRAEKAAEAEAAAKAAAEEEAKKAAEAETTENLLKQIRDLLAKEDAPKAKKK